MAPCAFIPRRTGAASISRLSRCAVGAPVSDSVVRGILRPAANRSRSCDLPGGAPAGYEVDVDVRLERVERVALPLEIAAARVESQQWRLRRARVAAARAEPPARLRVEEAEVLGLDVEAQVALPFAEAAVELQPRAAQAHVHPVEEQVLAARGARDPAAAARIQVAQPAADIVDRDVERGVLAERRAVGGEREGKLPGQVGAQRGRIDAGGAASDAPLLRRLPACLAGQLGAAAAARPRRRSRSRSFPSRARR